MSVRKILFWAHLTAGIAIGMVILSLSVTGLIMAFAPQFIDWSNRALLSVAIPSEKVHRSSLDIILAKAQSERLGEAIVEVTIKSRPSATIAVSFGKEKGSVYANPFTGEIVGKDSQIRFFLQSVENWHRWIASKKIGKPVIDACNLLFLFMIFSGIYLWWPRRFIRPILKAKMVPSFKLKGKARAWNWHHAAGFWMAPLLLATSVTGVMISYRWANDLVYTLTGTTAPRLKENTLPRVAQPPKGIVDSILSQIESKVPAWTALSLRMPKKPGGPILAQIQTPGIWGRMTKSQLSVNSATGDITSWETYSELNLGRKLRPWIVPIHTGQAAGIIGQILVTVTSLAAILLVWTGLALSWRRFNSNSFLEK